jgi:heme A synthase
LSLARPESIMEWFVRYVVAGGIALVAGLWAAAWFATGSGPWLAGVALAALGLVGLATGIGRELSV